MVKMCTQSDAVSWRVVRFAFMALFGSFQWGRLPSKMPGRNAVALNDFLQGLSFDTA